MKILDYINYRRACKRLFNTDDGKLVLAYLNLHKVKRSSLDKTPEHTYYNLGQKELVQSMTNDVNDPREIEELIIQNTIEE